MDVGLQCTRGLLVGNGLARPSGLESAEAKGRLGPDRSLALEFFAVLRFVLCYPAI